MKKLTFNIQDSDGQARTGELMVNHRQVKTPALVQVGGELGKIPGQSLQEIGVQAVKVKGMTAWLNEAEQLTDLHRTYHWPGLLLVDLQTELAYQWAKPRGKKGDGVRFHDPQTGQLKFWQPALGRQVQELLGADILQSFARNDDYYAPVDDLAAGTEQTAAWLGDVTEQATTSLGAVTGAGLKRLRQISIQAVDHWGFAGYQLEEVPANLSLAEFRRIINEMIPMMAPQRLRYLPTAGGLFEVFTAVSAGIDLIDSDIAARKASAGVALVKGGASELHLGQERFAGEGQVLDPQCQCLLCQQAYTRQALHQLVINHDYLGEQLLLEHNLLVLERLMARIRLAIRQQELDKFIREFGDNH